MPRSISIIAVQLKKEEPTRGSIAVWHLERRCRPKTELRILSVLSLSFPLFFVRRLVVLPFFFFFSLIRSFSVLFLFPSAFSFSGSARKSVAAPAPFLFGARNKLLNRKRPKRNEIWREGADFPKVCAPPVRFKLGLRWRASSYFFFFWYFFTFLFVFLVLVQRVFLPQPLAPSKNHPRYIYSLPLSHFLFCFLAFRISCLFAEQDK